MWLVAYLLTQNQNCKNINHLSPIIILVVLTDEFIGNSGFSGNDVRKVDFHIIPNS